MNNDDIVAQGEYDSPLSVKNISDLFRLPRTWLFMSNPAGVTLRYTSSMLLIFSGVQVAHLLILLCIYYFSYFMFFVVYVCFPCLFVVPGLLSFDFC